MKIKRTIFAAIAAAPVLALTGGFAYAATAGGGPASPAHTTITTVSHPATTTPAQAKATVQTRSQHPATQTCRGGDRWGCDRDHTGYQNSRSHGYQGSQWDDDHGYGGDCRH